MTAARVASGEANDQLTKALINAAARGIRPRCGDFEVSHYWLSEYEGERALAASWCTGCAVFAECGEVGQHQRFGTWAGIDRTVKPGRKKSEAA
jgi:hypothetical protein